MRFTFSSTPSKVLPQRFEIGAIDVDGERVETDEIGLWRPVFEGQRAFPYQVARENLTAVAGVERERGSHVVTIQPKKENFSAAGDFKCLRLLTNNFSQLLPTGGKAKHPNAGDRSGQVVAGDV